MSTKKKVYVVVLIWAAVILQLVLTKTFNRESMLVEQVMSEGVVDVTAAEVKAYASYGNETLGENARIQMVKNLGKKLGITSDYAIKTTTQEKSEVVTFSKKGEHGDTTIRMVSMHQKSASGESFQENYVMMDVALKGASSQEIYNYKEVLNSIYDGLGMEANTNIYLCSQKKGMLTDDEMEQEIVDFMDTMGAERVKTIELNQTLCVYGYSDSVKEYVYQNDNKVNVNIAFTYNEEEDITYIHRAVPFIDKSF